jgi:hypothetical protein
MKFVAAVTAAALVMVPIISFAQGAGGAGMSGTGTSGTGKGTVRPPSQGQGSVNPNQGQESDDPSQGGINNNSMPADKSE